MAKEIIIVVLISVPIVLGVGAWGFLASVTGPFLDPKVKITDMEFTPGSCQEEYFLFWKTGEHRTVAAAVTLSNQGLSAGEATVVFTMDGAKLVEAKFYIGAGMEETKTTQFKVSDCAGHVYGVYLGGVERK